jgi:transposase-like protein
MPMRYPKDFRRVVCARLVAGERVSSLSQEVGVSEGTLYLWKRQALIDAGRAEGVKSFEADELAQAHKTIAELEAELEITRAAVALFNGEEPVSPKAVPGCRGPEQPGLQRARGVSDRRGLTLCALRAQVPRPI